MTLSGVGLVLSGVGLVISDWLTFKVTQRKTRLAS
jgi:hypothetical protein